jgi:hypothetical protein
VIAVGIDVGTRAHHACFLESDGREVTRPLRFANNRQGVDLLQERLQSGPLSDVLSVYEA